MVTNQSAVLGWQLGKSVGVNELLDLTLCLVMVLPLDCLLTSQILVKPDAEEVLLFSRSSMTKAPQGVCGSCYLSLKLLAHVYIHVFIPDSTPFTSV